MKAVMRHHTNPSDRCNLKEFQAAVKHGEELKLLYTAKRNVNWNNHFGKLAIHANIEHMLWELTHNPTIPFLGIFSKEICTCVHQKT